MQVTSQTINRAQTERQLRDLGVAAIVLFGSQLTARSGPLSDTDLAILLHEPIDRHRTVALAAELEPLLAALVPMAHQLEVTILNTAPVSLQLEVMRHGRILAAYDALALAQFRELVMDRAGDLRPFLRAYCADRLRGLYA